MRARVAVDALVRAVSGTARPRALAAFACLALAAPAFPGGVTIVDGLFVGVWSPFGTRWEAESGVCIQGEESFRVIASSAGGKTFELRNGAGDRVPYRLFWRNRDKPGRGEQLDPGTPSRRAVVGSAEPDCGGAANARIRVRVERRAIDRAPPGIYGDTLLLMLSPL